MADKSITMNVDEVLELEYLVEELSDDSVTYNKNPSGKSSSYISTNTHVFSPDGIGLYELDINGQIIEIDVVDITDSVVTRPSDNNSGSNTDVAVGVRFESDSYLSDIQGRISDNMSGVTRAYIYRYSDGMLLGDTDISSLSSGDVFTISDVNIQPFDGTDGTRYNFVADDEDGGGYTRGYYDSPSFPYESSDGSLRIVSGASDATGTISGSAYFVNEIGNINLTK